MSSRLLSVWLEHFLYFIFSSFQEQGVFGSLVNQSRRRLPWLNYCEQVFDFYIIDNSHYNCWLIPSKIYLSNSINGRCYQTDSRWKLSWVEERRSQTSEGVKSKTYLNPQSKPAGGCWGGGGTERTYIGTWGEAAVAMSAEGELGVSCSLNRPQNKEFANGRCGESGMWHVTYSCAAQVVCLN